MSSEKPNFLSQPVVKNIFMFRNGDPYYEARRIVINQKRISNFETLLREVTGGIQAPFGAVRNIYTPTGGHRVDCMESLKSGEQYVAAGREKFKRLDYRQIGLRRRRMMQALPTQAKPLPQNRILVSARFLKPIKEPCTIFVVANGDVLDPATRLLIHQKILQQFDRILEMVTEKMGLRVLGGVRSLYTYEGQQVTDGNQLESGQLYVAVGRERFKKLPYSDMLFTKPRGTRRVLGMKAHSLPPIYRFSKHNGIIKSVGRNSDSGDQDFKISPQRRNCSNKEHLSSIVREISQARLISLRKNRSGQSMTLSMSDNVDLESKADDGLLEVKTPPDQPADKEPEDDDAKAAEENSEKAGEEEEEAAPKTTTEEDTSTNKEDEEENQETNDKKEEGGENKENDEAKGTEVTAGSREKQEEVDHEPTEEFIRESKEAPRKEEQRYGEKEEDGKLQGTDETKEELKVEEERYGEKEEEMEEGVKEQDTDDGKEELKEEEQRYGEEEEDVEEGGKEQGTDESQEELKEEEQRYAEKEEEVEERVKEQGTDESKEALKEEDQTYGEEEVEEGVNEQGTNKTKEELKKEEQSYGEEEVKEEVKEQGTYETKVELKEEGQMYGEKEEEVKEEVKEQGTYETKEELKKEEQSSGGKEEEFQEEVKGEVMVESKEDVKADEQECSSSNSDQTDDCLDKEDGNHPSPGYDQGGQDKNTEGEEQDKDSGKGWKSNEDPDKDIGEGKKEEEMENTNDPGKSRSDNKREESDSIRSSSRYSNQGEDVSKTKEGAKKEPGQWE